MVVLNIYGEFRVNNSMNAFYDGIVVKLVYV